MPPTSVIGHSSPPTVLNDKILEARLVELAKDRKGYEFAKAQYKSEVDVFANSQEYNLIDSVWRDHANGIAPDKLGCSKVKKFRSGILKLYFLHSKSFRNRENIADYKHHNKNENWTKQFFGTKDLKWKAKLDDALFSSKSAQEKILEIEQFCSFQEKTIRDRELYAPDIFTYKLHKCRDNFYLYGRGTHFFKGSCPYYLITGGAGQKAVAIVVPRDNLVLDFQANLASVVSDDALATTFAAQIKRIASNHDAFSECLALDEAQIQKKEIVLNTGQIENFAHHIWNFYSGIEKICFLQYSKNIDRILSFGSEFCGSIDRIFPEFIGRYEHLKRGGVQTAGAFDPSRLMLQTGGYFITSELKSRILKSAVETVTARGGDTFERLEGPVVWFGLRVGSRAWNNQQEDIVRIIERVSARYPDCNFVLDGFTYPVGQDEISGKWTNFIDNIGKLSAEIVEKAPAKAQLINLVGRKMDEAFILASKTCAYVAPIGSTQHKVGWFSPGKGLVYSGPNILKVKNEMRPGSWEAEGINIAEYMIGTPVESGERRSAIDRRNNLENVDIDVDHVEKFILDAIEAAMQPVQASTASGHRDTNP